MTGNAASFGEEDLTPELTGATAGASEARARGGVRLNELLGSSSRKAKYRSSQRSVKVLCDFNELSVSKSNNLTISIV